MFAFALWCSTWFPSHPSSCSAAWVVYCWYSAAWAGVTRVPDPDGPFSNGLPNERPPTRVELMRTAFKEWAIIVDALARGDQILILRKGGISEGREGFQIDH